MTRRMLRGVRLQRAFRSLACPLLLVLSAGAGCETEVPGHGDPPRSIDDDAGSRPAVACRPDRELYDQRFKPLFAQYCGDCHGPTPQAGAPFSLTSYDALLASYRKARVVDAVALALADDQMPPSYLAQPSEEERTQWMDWASCGHAEHIGMHDGDGGQHSGGESGGGSTSSGGSGEHTGGDSSGEHTGGGNNGGLVVSREPVTVSPHPPAGTTAIDFTLDEFTPPIKGDHYEQKTLTNLVTKDVFIRYFEPVIDDGRVVHHLTLRYGGDRTGYLYLWGPGSHGMEFPNGGVRLRPTDTLLLEIHYHNGVEAADIKDSSGVRLHVSAPGGTEYGVANLATWDIFVRKNSSGEAHATCNVENPVHVFGALPHMHQIGDSFDHVITHADGSTESLISLTGWEFHLQRAYVVDLDLVAGDRLDMTCRYVNPYDHPVTAGVRTTDEMCFDFLYVTPPDALENCNDKNSI